VGARANDRLVLRLRLSPGSRRDSALAAPRL